MYVHTRTDTGGVFYVGKGTEYGNQGGQARRRRNSLRDRSKCWHRIVNKAGGFQAHVIGEFDNEADAVWAERAMIRYFGRRDLDAGQLVNHTDGGDGVCGMRHTPESRARIGAASRGKKRIFTPEWRAKLQAMNAAKRGKPTRRGRIVSVIDGTEWVSVRSAAIAIGVKDRTLNAALTGGNAINRWGIRRIGSHT